MLGVTGRRVRTIAEPRCWTSSAHRGSCFFLSRAAFAGRAPARPDQRTLQQPSFSNNSDQVVSAADTSPRCLDNCQRNGTRCLGACKPLTAVLSHRTRRAWTVFDMRQARCPHSWHSRISPDPLGSTVGPSPAVRTPSQRVCWVQSSVQIGRLTHFFLANRLLENRLAPCNTPRSQSASAIGRSRRNRSGVRRSGNQRVPTSERSHSRKFCAN